jgi:DNA-binding LytR/AlgR family response regulator
VTDAPPPSALREIRTHLTAPLVLATLAGVTLILAISGPFRTLEALSLIDRLIYWTAVVFLTYGAGTVITGWLGRHSLLRPVSFIPRVIIVSVAVGLGVSVVLTLIDVAVLGDLPDDLLEWLLTAATAFLISAVIVILGSLAARDRPQDERPAVVRPAIILDRLPFEKRGTLVSLSAQDHYVRISTTKGSAMILMRLSDAIREAGDTSGLQVHRAHWVARAAVVAARKTGETAILTLRDGTEIPVSRRYVPTLRDAGLLPARSPVRSSGQQTGAPRHD